MNCKTPVWKLIPPISFTLHFFTVNFVVFMGISAPCVLFFLSSWGPVVMKFQIYIYIYTYNV